MQDPSDLQQQILQQHDVLQQQREALQQLQEAKLKALQDTIGNYGNFRYVNLNDFLDPDNQNWNDYKWSKLPAFESAKRQGRVSAGTPVGEFIQQIRDAENIDDVKKQLELWNSSDPLSSYDNGINYIRNFIPRFAMRVTTPSTDGSGSVQTTAGGTQGSNNGSGGTFASAGVPKGGTKTIGYGYDSNPGTDVTDAVVKAVKADGNTSFANWRQSLVNQGWNGDPSKIKYDPSIGKFMRREPVSLTGSSSTYASSNISSGGTYATGEGIKDANGNVLTYGV